MILLPIFRRVNRFIMLISTGTLLLARGSVRRLVFLRQMRRSNSDLKNVSPTANANANTSRHWKNFQSMLEIYMRQVLLFYTISFI